MLYVIQQTQINLCIASALYILGNYFSLSVSLIVTTSFLIPFPLCSALEDSMSEEAIQLYTDACTILEDDGREQMAFDLYRAATNVYIKLEK